MSITPTHRNLLKYRMNTTVYSGFLRFNVEIIPGYDSGKVGPLFTVGDTIDGVFADYRRQQLAVNMTKSGRGEGEWSVHVESFLSEDLVRRCLTDIILAVEKLPFKITNLA